MKYELTGISTPIVGASWVKTATGKEMFIRLFLFLESKRAIGAHVEDGDRKRELVVRSVLEIKNTIIVMTEGINLRQFDLEILRALLGYCNSFLEKIPADGQVIPIYDKTGELLNTCSYHSARMTLIEGFYREIQKVEKKYNLTYMEVASDYRIERDSEWTDK